MPKSVIFTSTRIANGVKKMGIKVTVNEKGVVSEKQSGTDKKFVIDSKVVKNVFHPGVDTGVTVTNVKDPVIVLEAASAGVTASLPALSTELLGTQVTFLNVEAETFDVSGTNPINGSTWDATVSTRGYCLLAVSSSANGYSWEQLF